MVFVILIDSVGLIVLFLIILSGIHSIQLKNERHKIDDYGEKMEIDGNVMCYKISGKGEKTIVLLPGYTTASPIIDFKNLVDQLEKHYRVIVIEPFGYGLSDDSKKRRSVENMITEIHDVLEKNDVANYLLLAHSISGVYSLAYIKKYRDEVDGFIGIDSSLPSQGGASNNKESLVRLLSKSGLLRISTIINPKILHIQGINDSLKKQYRYLALKNIGSNAIFDEAREMAKNFEKTKQLSYPKDLPIIFFLATESVSDDNRWLTIHQEMLDNHEKAKIKIMKGPHYLHRVQANGMVEQITSFFNS